MKRVLTELRTYPKASRAIRVRFLDASFACFVGLLLSGCSMEVEIPKGEIVRKEHQPEFSEEKMTNVTLSKGKLKVSVPTRMKHIDDEDFILYVKKKSAYSDQEEIIKIFTSKETYESKKVGDMFEFDLSTFEIGDEIEMVSL